jgi:hypothetical protein
MFRTARVTLMYHRYKSIYLILLLRFLFSANHVHVEEHASTISQHFILKIDMNRADLMICMWNKESSPILV